MKKLLLVLLILLLPVMYIYWFYFNVYSDGEREGVMMKISRKGNVFKTFEGEIMQPGFRTGSAGINSNNFKFTAIDDVVSKKLSDATGRVVKVHYVQYRKTLPWRGDNYDSENAEMGQYIVDRIVEVGAVATPAQTQMPMMLPSLTAPASAPAVAPGSAPGSAPAVISNQ